MAAGWEPHLGLGSEKDRMRKDKRQGVGDVRGEEGETLATPASCRRPRHGDPLAADFEQLGDVILARLRLRRALRAAIVQARVRLGRLTERLAHVMRAAELAAIEADGGQRGALSEVVFPPESSQLRRIDVKQRLRSGRRLVRRLWPLKVEGIPAYEAYHREWFPKIGEALCNADLALLVYERARDDWEAASEADAALHDAQVESLDMLVHRVGFPIDFP